MGQYFSRKQLTDKEREDIKKERDNYQNYLKICRQFINNFLKEDKITPESANELNALIKKQQDWLKNHPDAGDIQIKAQRDELNGEADAIMERERPKINLSNFILFNEMIVTLKDWVQTVKKEELKAQIAVTKTARQWYKSHPKEEGLTQDQQLDTQYQQVRLAVPSKQQELSWLLSFSKSLGPKAVQDILSHAKSAQELYDKSNFDAKKFTDEVKSTTSRVFWSLLLAVLIVLGASLAANMAIGRDVKQRVQQFLFGLIPWVTPFIQLQAFLQWMRGNPLTQYAILPIITDPPKTRGEVLWKWPFFQQLDANAHQQMQNWNEMITQVGQAVLSTPKMEAV